MTMFFYKVECCGKKPKTKTGVLMALNYLRLICLVINAYITLLF